MVELRTLVPPDREWKVPGGGGGEGGGGDGGGAQGAKAEGTKPPAQPRPPSSGSGARDLPCSKGCGRRFGWPPARVSHEKLCAGGAAAADDATSSHACTAVAVWCTDRPRPALQLTLALALALTLTRCTDRPRPALQLSDGMDEVRATPTSLEP